MISIDLRCRECGTTVDMQFDDAPPQVLDFHCDECELVTRHDRVWTPFNLARVQGAGGSPSR